MSTNKNILIDEPDRARHGRKGDGLEVSAGLPEANVLRVVLRLAVLFKVVSPRHIREEVEEGTGPASNLTLRRVLDSGRRRREINVASCPVAIFKT